MSFYADPSFFILLIAAVIPAAILGLAEKPLGRYGAVASVILIACLFCKTPLEGFYAACYLALSCASIQWLLRSPSSRRFWVSLSLALAPLIVYKVSAAFDQSLLGFLGISYLTFKSVQMVLEIHDGIIDRMAPLDTFAFLVFFPTFTSGPIDRSRRFLEDAHAVRPKDEYAGMLARGILLIVAGLVYKLFIAGLMYKSYSLAPWGTADFFWELFLQVKTAYVYGFYLFFDFAGYSLMAIGASWCFGIKTPRNFRAPFIAVDIKDFWNRWHMTLSFWLRDFVFHAVRPRIHEAQAVQEEAAYVAVRLPGEHDADGRLARVDAELPRVRGVSRRASGAVRALPEEIVVLQEEQGQSLVQGPLVDRHHPVGDARVRPVLRTDISTFERTVAMADISREKLESRMLGLLEEVCESDAVLSHRDEDLFALGLLDSMAAVELLVRIEDDFGVSIAPTEVARTEMNTVNLIISQVEARL